MSKTIALRLDPETRRQLDLLAEASGYAPATLVAEAVRRFVEVEMAAMIALQEGEEGAEGELAPLPERWNLIV